MKHPHENGNYPTYPTYKRVPMTMPHCPRCGEMLRGNNSMISPWECSCGVWKSNWGDPLNYTITPRKEKECFVHGDHHVFNTHDRNGSFCVCGKKK